jgi:hypothetical protein
MATIRSDIQKQAQSALIQYAVFRWESAVVVALTIVLTVLFPKPFSWWPWFGWLLLGVAGLAAIIYSSLTDAKTNANVLLKLFQDQFDTKQIKDRELRAEVEEALEYQRRIEVQVQNQREGLVRERLEDTANQTTDWISHVYALALRLDRYGQDELLARERETLPREIETLTAQRQRERNPQVQAKLDEVITSKGKHWQAIRALDARMKQASLQLDQSTTALATVYSQLQLIEAQGINSGGAERLQADIREQVARLNDLVMSINEVYDYSTQGIG